MRLLLCALAALSLSALILAAGEFRPATPDEAALFREAIKNGAQEPQRWAYTETTRMKVGVRGQPRGETVVRFDRRNPTRSNTRR